VLVVAAFLEVLARRPRHRAATTGIGYLLAIAAATSVITAVLGWMLSQAGGYDERLVGWHFWTGIATAGLSIVAAILYRMDAIKAYRACLAFTLLALIVASHFGGSLTHGSDYLVRHAPVPLRALLGMSAGTAVKNPQAIGASPSAYISVIHPVLDKYCVACHGPEKSKGGLRMDSFDLLVKGGDNGPGVTPRDPARSQIIERMRLPVDDDDHMPPDGKAQPSPDDIALIEWWIAQGALKDAPIEALEQTAQTKRILAGRTAQPAPMLKAVQQAKTITREEAVALGETLGAKLSIAISPLSETDPVLLCNAGLAGTNFTDAQFTRLASSGIAPHTGTLDLGGTAVSDAGLAALTNFSGLKRLHLERAMIGDEGLKAVAALPELEYLNLYGTKVTDAGLAYLNSAPKLKRVYLWQTSVTPEGVEALVAARTDEGEKLRLEQEIQRLQAELKEHRMIIELGVPLVQPTNTTAVAAAAKPPVNTTCPISGKPVDVTKTLEHEGKVYAFCCDQCLAKARQDPKAVLANVK
jgi:YHS domain-containing protein